MADNNKRDKRKNINSSSSSTVIISCAGDSELARSLYHFLSDKFSYTKTSQDDDEVYIKKYGDDNRSLLPSAADVKAALKEFLLNASSSLDRSKSEKLTINNLGEDVFVIAFKVDAEDIGLHKCSWCGMLMESEGELELHEKLHGIIGTGGGIGI